MTESNVSIPDCICLLHTQKSSIRKIYFQSLLQTISLNHKKASVKVDKMLWRFDKVIYVLFFFKFNHRQNLNDDASVDDDGI